MQIPPASSAAQAASILAQTSAKDKSSGIGGLLAGPGQPSLPHVEKSGSADADRDAQGQGDGFAEHGRSTADDNDTLDIEQNEPAVNRVGHLPDEPPSQLDIIG